ncbi:MAG TPA: trypsin-like peptidase domain-containing protein [Isosphaeraceae bacterium]|jgi:regulation of enolase protein 1 (concanavalin A-like superfamily)|nr:trypsin-like peptidase domain-containing protein [Isosphaeraceae bacterium]
MRVLIVAACVSLCASVGRADDTIPRETLSRLKDATVYVWHEEARLRATGSGFLIANEGTSGFVATNHHVIAPERSGERPRLTVYLRSGTKAERGVRASVVASDPERDLAILRVDDVPDLPRPVDLNRPADLIETMTVYSFGFPLGQDLALGSKHPAVTVGKSAVTSLRRDTQDRVRSVVLERGTLSPGSSGGPIVDADGRLVGIVVAGNERANIAIAIGPAQLLAMLRGRPEGVEVKVASTKDGRAVLDIAVPLVDPLRRVASARLSYAVADRPAGAEPDDPDEAGWPPMKGMTGFPLKVADRRGAGRLALDVPKGEGMILSYQATLTDLDGKTRHARPGRCFLLPGKGAVGLESWGDAIDPDGDCLIRIDDGGVVFEVPGTLHDLNADISKWNAPRLLRAVDGDFVATVKVGGTFQPGEPTTNPRSVPFNGGGLVLWRDPDHFIRLERGATLRDGRRGRFALFERRELGVTNAKHNGPVPDGDPWLRLERRGDQVLAATSPDGTTWADLQPIAITWPARLKVGLDAVNSSGEPMTVQFHEYSVEEPWR